MADPLLALSPDEAETVGAVFERIFPADEAGPGADEIGVVTYLDLALAGALAGHRETYRIGLEALKKTAVSRYERSFAELSVEKQDDLLRELELGTMHEFRCT